MLESIGAVIVIVFWIVSGILAVFGCYVICAMLDEAFGRNYRSRHPEEFREEEDE